MNTNAFFTGTLFGLSVATIIVMLIILNTFWSVASALLAHYRRGRNACNWFFLSLFYGVYGLILLGCSKTLNKGEYQNESDTLSKVLWSLVVVPIIVFFMLLVLILSTNAKNEELNNKVLEQIRTEEINKRNRELIQRNENISNEEARRLLRDLGLEKDEMTSE